MSGVGRTDGLDFSETVGAYFRPGCASRFFDVRVSDLADTAVAVGDISGEPAELRSTAWLALQECHANISRESSASGSV